MTSFELFRILNLKNISILYIFLYLLLLKEVECEGWSGGAMVLGTLLVPGRPTNLD